MGLYDLDKTKFLKLNIQRFAATLELDCEESGISVSNNTSNVYVTITAKRTSGSTFWDDEKRGTVECDGETKSFYLSLPSSKSSNSTEVKFSNIEHDSNGSKTVKVSASITPGSSIGELYKSTRFKLTDIPRYANITSFNVTNLSGFDGLNKLKINYSVDSEINYAWYSVDNGANWYDLPATWVIENLQPGTGYNVKIRVRRTDSGLTTDSATIYIVTLSQAYITSGTPNITNGQGLRVIANNPSGAKCRFDLQVPIGTTRLIKTGPDVTFSAQEINSMMQYITSQSTRIRIYVTTLNDAETVYYNNYVDGTYTIVNSEPTFNYFEYEDINEKTLALTGNEETCVVGYSNIKATIPTANKAIAKNYATMSKYRLTIGNDSVEALYSNSNDVSLTLNNIKASTFSLFAIDSRGIASVVNKVPTTVISYSNLVKNNDIVASRVDSKGQVVGASELVKVTFSGQIWQGDFGTKENSIIGFSYRYKATYSNTWSEWIDLDTSLLKIGSNGKFTFDNLIKGDTDGGFDESNSYNIEFAIYDELSSVGYQTNVGGGIPHLCWDKNGMGVMGKYDKEKGGLFQIGGVPINELIGQNSMSLQELKQYISNGTLINELIGLGTTCKNVSYTNWNTICENKTGFYMGNGMANSPLNSIEWYYVLNISHNELYSVQIASNFFSSKRLYSRIKSGGTWGEWCSLCNDGDVLWWADTNGTATYPSFYTNGYKYIEIIMYHSGHGVIKSSGKILFNQVNGTYFSFYDAGTTSEYYSRVYITDSACAINTNWEKTLGASHWNNSDSWKIRGVIGYY